MSRRALVISALAPLLFSLFAPQSQGGEDPRIAQRFVQGLRERGYFDLALEYLEKLRKDPEVTPELRNLLDFEEGKTRIQAGTRASDSERAQELFEQARVKLEAFIKANPEHPDTSEAIVDLAQLLYERGRTAMIQADEIQGKTEKDVKINEARASFAAAREAYGKAFERFDAEFKKYKTFLEANDPLFAAREKAQAAALNADLQRSVVDYEEAQTYPLDSPERNQRLDTVAKAFKTIHESNRTLMAGIAAHMWEAKCYEERGELSQAKAIYDELMQHAAPQLRAMQKKVDYFRIIIMVKRKQYAAAADECVRWLNAFPNDRRSYEALGVQLELAKNILAQLPEIEDSEKPKATARAADSLKEVVKVYSPFKQEALTLLKQISPKTAFKAEDIARLTFDEAMGQADQAISLQQYEQANGIIQLAMKKGDAGRDIAKLNRARYTQAFCLYMSKRFFEAAVITEHLARRYPNGEWSAKATEIAIAAMIDAYNAYTRGDRSSDLARLLDLARFTATTYPDTEQGDAARMTIGQVTLGRGEYDKAIEAFESVRKSSTRSADAQASAGDARWKQSLRLRDSGKTDEADAEMKKSVALYLSAIKTRKDSGATNADIGLIGNSCDLAGIYLETGKVKEALALLEPLARDLSTGNRPAGLNAAYGRTLSSLLRAHVLNGQVDAAINDMTQLERAGGESKDRALLYFELGRLLEREMEALKKRGDTIALKRTTAAYQKFLDALVKSKSGQTYESLSWAGSNLLKLGAGSDAEVVFQQILDTYGKDTTFTSQPTAADKLMFTRLKLAAAYRIGGKLDQADALLAEIIKTSPRLLQAQMERGNLISAKAAAKKGTWNEAFTYWQNLGTRLRGANPKPVEYFESWYNAALALEGQGKGAQAKQLLAGIMRLSPSVGTPEMKARYQTMIARIK